MKFEQFELCKTEDLKVGDLCIIKLVYRPVEHVTNCKLVKCGHIDSMTPINNRLEYYKTKDINLNEMEEIFHLKECVCSISYSDCHLQGVSHRMEGPMIFINDTCLYHPTDYILRYTK